MTGLLHLKHQHLSHQLHRGAGLDLETGMQTKQNVPFILLRAGISTMVVLMLVAMSLSGDLIYRGTVRLGVDSMGMGLEMARSGGLSMDSGTDLNCKIGSRGTCRKCCA